MANVRIHCGSHGSTPRATFGRAIQILSLPTSPAASVRKGMAPRCGVDHRGGVCKAPVDALWIAREHRAALCGTVANRDDVVELSVEELL